MGSDRLAVKRGPVDSILLQSTYALDSLSRFSETVLVEEFVKSKVDSIPAEGSCLSYRRLTNRSPTNPRRYPI